jgi:hypothetical protein
VQDIAGNTGIEWIVNRKADRWWVLYFSSFLLAIISCGIMLIFIGTEQRLDLGDGFFILFDIGLIVMLAIVPYYHWVQMPHQIGFSEEGISFRYERKTDTIRWDDIKEIGKKGLLAPYAITKSDNKTNPIEHLTTETVRRRIDDKWSEFKKKRGI